MDQLGDFLSNDFPLIRIGVANGGYVVASWKPDPKDPDGVGTYEVDVHTSIAGLLGSVERIVKLQEGNRELRPGMKLGPLRVEEDRP